MLALRSISVMFVQNPLLRQAICHNINSVSYTHLDVYKRQIYPHAYTRMQHTTRKISSFKTEVIKSAVKTAWDSLFHLLAENKVRERSGSDSSYIVPTGIGAVTRTPPRENKVNSGNQIQSSIPFRSHCPHSFSSSAGLKGGKGFT